jgi:hypothetical protein
MNTGVREEVMFRCPRFTVSTVTRDNTGSNQAHTDKQTNNDAKLGNLLIRLRNFGGTQQRQGISDKNLRQSERSNST